MTPRHEDNEQRGLTKENRGKMYATGKAEFKEKWKNKRDLHFYHLNMRYVHRGDISAAK